MVDNASDKATSSAEQKQAFYIRQIFIKSMSFESIVPMHSLMQDWKPSVDVDISTNSALLDGSEYEISVHARLSASNQGTTIFTVEAVQAGIFSMEGFEGEQMTYLTKSHCPTILFPYVRELISGVITRGGYPALYLSPVDFEAKYRAEQTQK